MCPLHVSAHSIDVRSRYTVSDDNDDDDDDWGRKYQQNTQTNVHQMELNIDV